MSEAGELWHNNEAPVSVVKEVGSLVQVVAGHVQASWARPSHCRKHSCIRFSLKIVRTAFQWCWRPDLTTS